MTRPARARAALAGTLAAVLAAAPSTAVPRSLASSASLSSAGRGRADAASSEGTPTTRRASEAPAPAATAFVTRAGSTLSLDGRPFRFVGANVAVMHEPPMRAGFAAVLAAAAADGATVVRLFAFGEGPPDAPDWQRRSYVLRAGPDGWLEPALVHLDRVLAEVARLGLRAIVTLGNQWADYGGVPQYLDWWGLDDGRQFGAPDRFYAEPRVRAAYRAQLERVVGRKSTVTGRPYRDDPTILSWELLNESTLRSPASESVRKAWIAEMAGVVRRLDAHHLVTPGLAGYRTRRGRQAWLEVCRMPEVDYCDAHLYPESMQRLRRPADLDRAIEELGQLARGAAGKPLVVGELGVAGPHLGVAPAAWVARGLARLSAIGAAGGLVWEYAPDEVADRPHVLSPSRHDHPVRRAVAAAARALAQGAESGLAEPAVAAGRRAQEPLVVDDALPGRGLGPLAASHARWEGWGRQPDGPRPHLWGAESGFFEWTVVAADIAGLGREGATPTGGARLVVEARLSSEWPGTLAPDDGFSDGVVLVDGQVAGTFRAWPDDGRGRVASVASTDAAIRARLRAPGRHTVRLAVPEGPHANGLCVYGALAVRIETGGAAAAAAYDAPP